MSNKSIGYYVKLSDIQIISIIYNSYKEFLLESDSRYVDLVKQHIGLRHDIFKKNDLNINIESIFLNDETNV